MKFSNIHKKIADLQLCLKETPTQIFSSEYCKLFKKVYFEEHLLMAASDFLKQLQSSDEQLLVLISDNLLTGYEKLSY